MPSEKYFDNIADPVIQFTDEVVRHYDFKSIYGKSIDSFVELTSFIAGDNGARLEPEEDDLKAPNVFNIPLFNQAQDLHKNSLDNWTPPANVEVIQIAGWGLDTIYALEYGNCDSCLLGTDLSNLDRDVKKTIDGDGTVVDISALIDETATAYYLNMFQYNDDHGINRAHANILEVDAVLDLVQKITMGDDSASLSYVSEDKPIPVSGDTRYRLRMKSPVAVHVYNSEGRHVGLRNNPDSNSDIQLYEEQIPNSSYFELGTRKYISLDDNDTYTIKLAGEASGIFTFEIDEVEGDEVVKTTTFNRIPTTAALTGELLLNPALTEDLELTLDFDNDGTNDATVGANETLAISDSFKTLQQAITDAGITDKDKKQLLQRLEQAIKHYAKSKPKQTITALDKLDSDLENYGGSDSLREIIAVIKEKL